jgi:uncharacterized protein YdhG (YjbR/CyaY superfamily)
VKKETPETIDDYVARFPSDVRRDLTRIRNTIRKAAPKAKEKISYKIPAFTLDGNLIYFAAFKKHIGLYPGTSTIRKFKKKLSAYECTKGAIRFPFGNAIPVSLIAEIVKFRVTENREASAAKAKSR